MLKVVTSCIISSAFSPQPRSHVMGFHMQRFSGPPKRQERALHRWESGRAPLLTRAEHHRFGRIAPHQPWMHAATTCYFPAISRHIRVALMHTSNNVPRRQCAGILAIRLVAKAVKPFPFILPGRRRGTAAALQPHAPSGCAAEHGPTHHSHSHSRSSSLLKTPRRCQIVRIVEMT